MRDGILDKIERVEDLSAEISTLIDGDDDFTVQETLSSISSIFTETKLLMIHSFIEEHNSSNLQQCSKSALENNRTLPLSGAFINQSY